MPAVSTPAINKAFETDHFVYTRDLYKFYVAGTQFENPGPSLSGLVLNYPGRTVGPGRCRSDGKCRHPENAK